jgi:hypothetical protein
MRSAAVRRLTAVAALPSRLSRCPFEWYPASNLAMPNGMLQSSSVGFAPVAKSQVSFLDLCP